MWPGISYETCAWKRDLDELAIIPKSRRRKSPPTYKAAVPASIAALPVEIPARLAQRIAEVEVALARFDTAREARDYALPALLLRSESSSSSQIERLTSSARNVALVIVIGARVASDVDEILAAWASANTDRAGSASHRLPALLVEQPVVDVAYVALRLGITDRAARSLVETACERGTLSKMGNAKRGAFYQAPDLIAVLEEASSPEGIRRIAVR